MGEWCGNEPARRHGRVFREPEGAHGAQVLVWVFLGQLGYVSFFFLYPAWVTGPLGGGGLG